MTDSPDADDIDIDDALEQLFEIQRRIDDRARRIVERVKRVLDSREVLVPGVSEPFARVYGQWYDTVQRDLAHTGFQYLGAFQAADPGDKPPEERSFYGFALSADRTVVASWFLVPAKMPHRCVVLGSASVGTRCITCSGITDMGFPLPPNQHVHRFPADTPVATLLEAHRELVSRLCQAVRAFGSMAEILESRDRDARELSEFRGAQGVALFEPMLRTTYGDRFEDEGAPVLESIRNHPEWWTGEPPVAAHNGVATSDQPPRMMFLFTRDESDLGHLSTVGLAFRGLPELQMKELAANHCRAARFLMSAVARTLVAHATRLPRSDEPLEDRLSGIELTITPDDSRPSPVLLHPMEGRSPGPVRVRLELEDFGGDGARAADIFSALFTKKHAPRLLRLRDPAGDGTSADEWLRETCRQLGMDAPEAQPIAAFQSAMEAASRQAVRDLAALRHRLDAGLPDGQILAIKTGLPTTSGVREYVWIKVERSEPGAFVGSLESEPRDCPEFAKGQTLRVADADVFDCGIFTPSGSVVEPARTDVVAQDFGVDLPG